MLTSVKDETADMDEMWNLPNPPEVKNRLHADGSSPRELLEDVEFELGALMSNIASQQGLPNPVATQMWSSAERDVERTLGAQGCECRMLWFHKMHANAKPQIPGSLP